MNGFNDYVCNAQKFQYYILYIVIFTSVLVLIYLATLNIIDLGMYMSSVLSIVIILQTLINKKYI